MPRLTESDIASVGGIYTLLGIVVVVVLILGAFWGLFYWLMHRKPKAIMIGGVGQGHTYSSLEAYEKAQQNQK